MKGWREKTVRAVEAGARGRGGLELRVILCGKKAAIIANVGLVTQETRG